MPHYNASITNHIDWALLISVLFSFCAIGIYIAVRLWYLISGLSNVFPADAHVVIWYSWLVLAAEAALAATLLLGQLPIVRQRVNFAPVRDGAVWGMTKVRMS